MIMNSLVKLIKNWSSLGVSKFSPYELFLKQDCAQRVAFVAGIKEGELEALKIKLLSFEIKSDELKDALEKLGFFDLRFHHVELDGVHVLYATVMSGTKSNNDESERLFQKSDLWQPLKSYLKPHARASKNGQLWLKMEWMNIVNHQEGREGKKYALVSELRGEKELQYRSLHQTNWPGVIDQMKRSNYNNWITHLVELGDRLYLFTSYEYVGKDKDLDDSKFHEDPVTTRWWRHTEPCLKPVKGSDRNWLEMETLLEC
jgi:L-rhamnose mutarotase